MSFSMPLLPANLAALVIALSDRFFLERLATLDEVGVYAVADKMATVLQVLLVSTFEMRGINLYLPIRRTRNCLGRFERPPVFMEFFSWLQ